MSAIRTALGAPPERSTREAAAVLRTGTVCPNCHRPAGANRSQSPLSGIGFGSGPGGQMTEQDLRALRNWVEGQQGR